MKNPYLKSQSLVIKLSFIVLVVLSIIVIHSCHKDLKTSESSSEQVLVKNGINMAMLQAAYNKGTAKTKLQVTDIGQQTIANIINSLTVDWTSYSIFTYPDSTQVVEFSMPDDTTLLAPNMQGIGDTAKYFSKTAAVFVLRQDTIAASFFMKTVEDGTAPGYQSVLNYIHYQQIPGSFTGNVFYFTLNRQFLNGWAWDNGSITSALSLGAITTQPPVLGDAKNKLRANEVALPPCTEITYTIYCNTIANGVITHSEYLFSIVVDTPCPDSTTSPPSSSNVSSGGASSSPPVPVNNPCNAASNAAAVQSIKGRVVDVAEGGTGTGTGSSGSSSNPCVTVTKINITDKITDTQLQTCLQAILNKLLSLHNAASQKNGLDANGSVVGIVEDFSGNAPGYNWTMQSGTLNVTGANALTFPSYNKATGTVTTTFSNTAFSNASDLAIVGTFLHESVHAYLVQYFATNPVTGSDPSTTPFPTLLNVWSTTNDLSVAQHSEMILDFMNDIAVGLQQYGDSQGYIAPNANFYSDLAWAGLTANPDGSPSSLFLSLVPNQSDRNRILDNISIEQSGRNMDGDIEPQVGKPSGC
jgi:hypothetical protein